MATNNPTGPKIVATPSKKDLEGGGLMGYLRGVREELRKAHWPTRAELFRLTQVVLALIGIVAAYCGALDALLGLGTNRIFNRNSDSSGYAAPAQAPAGNDGAPRTDAPATSAPSATTPAGSAPSAPATSTAPTTPTTTAPAAPAPATTTPATGTPPATTPAAPATTTP